jgi:dipeptidyl aminopeptidase/acylaminoacyl peptidase
VAGADGSNQVALTGMGPTAMGSPRWSPDSQTVAFDRYENEHSTIYTVSADGGKPRRITGDGFRDFRPSFSHDGKWIYFASNRSGRVEIWKVAAEGGEPQKMTGNSGIEAFESADGKLLYYVSGQTLWAMPLAGGDPRQVLEEPVFLLYAVAGRSVYYGVRNPPGLWVLRTDTGQKFEYARFPKQSFGFDGGTVFSVSADERTIYFSQTDRMESDLMLLDHFR